MKKVLAALVLLAASTVARAQIIDFAYHLTSSAYPLNGGVAGSGSGVGPYSGTPVLGDLICFDGANWVSIVAGTSGDFLGANTGACPTYQALPAAAGAVTLQGSSPGTPDVGNWNVTGVGTSTHDNIHATLTPGLFLSNTQAALVGQQQEYSPSLKLCGAAWNAASETDCWQIFNRPIAGNPTTEELSFQASLAGAAYVERMKLNSAGKLTLGEATATDGQITLNGATSGSVTFAPVAGALGTQTITVPASTGTMLVSPAALNSLATQAARTWVVNATNGAAVPTALAGGGELTTIVDTGTALEAENLPYDLTKWDVINTSFNQRSATAGATTINNVTISVTGTSAGNVVSPALLNDSNHPGIIELTTGTTSTGGFTLGIGTSMSSAVGGGATMSGGEVLDWLIYVPVASGGTNTFRIYVGFCNTAGNGVCTDGAFVTWDNNTDTHWAVDTVKATVHSGPTLSNTVATAAAWHHIKITYVAATGFHYFVDGVELNVSPVNTQVPVNNVAPAVKMVASAGCAAATTCVMDINTLYYRKPVSR